MSVSARDRMLVVTSVMALSSAWLAGCEAVRPPYFPHRAHLTAAECGEPGQPECATCVSCHGKIRQTERVATEPVSDCDRCHSPGSDDVRSEQQRLARSTPRSRSIRFVHAEHLPLPEVGGECVSCHTGVSHDGRQGKLYPTMPECLTCHDDLFRAGDCTSCHRGRDWRRRAPQTFARHDLGFVRDHRMAATSQEHLCRNCHDQAECNDCHDTSQTLPVAVRRVTAIDRELIHRADFVTRHAIEARSRPARCVRCHSEASCDSCHVERGVSPSRVGSVSPHPVGWIGSDPTSPNYHGRNARRDIVSCASCHERGPVTNCIRCHTVGGFGGNPHPDGWASARAEDQGMCGYCHVR